MAYVEETKEIYTWNEEKNEWIKVEAANGQGLELNLYDLNKSALATAKALNVEQEFLKKKI